MADGKARTESLKPTMRLSVAANFDDELIKRIKDATISGKIAKEVVFPALWSGQAGVDDVIAEQGLQQVSASGALEQLVEDILAQKQDQVAQYRDADPKRRKKLLGGFMGPIMAASKGQANPAMVSKILQQKLAD